MSTGEPLGKFAIERVAEFLRIVELMASGDTRKRLEISPRHDELDAIAHGVNVLVGELEWTTNRMLEAQEERAVNAERANASKTTLLRNISHEIRSPIMAMMGFADLLASSETALEDRPELVRRLHANGHAVLALLDDLLDLARVEAHKIVLAPEDVSVVELVRDVFAALRVDGRVALLDMRIDAAPDASGTIRTDRQRLRQVLVNVVGNAVKFTRAGSVVVSVTRDRDGQRWTIDIADTGIGISPDRHQFLFEPFEQASTSIARVYGGSGLGLALSRRLAEHLGGSLTLVRSAPGQGTVFCLTLTPLPRAAEPGRTRGREVSNDDLIAIQGLRILLAEDHPDLHEALRRQLQRAGATVESAHDGEQAVAKVGSGEFDLILMDLRLPHMDGLEAIRALRGQGCAVPIIALTADPTSFHREAALEAGCNTCLSKPFEMDELIASIRQMTQKKR